MSSFIFLLTFFFILEYSQDNMISILYNCDNHSDSKKEMTMETSHEESEEDTRGAFEGLVKASRPGRDEDDWLISQICQEFSSALS